MPPTRLGALESVKDQIGACGIWCGSCVIGNGTLQQLTKSYRQLLADYDLRSWGPKDFDFGEFLKGLRSLEAVPLCPGCRRGGGRDRCPLRECASGRQLAYCSQCDAGAACQNPQLLDHMRSGASAAGLLTDATSSAPQGHLEEWSATLRRRWPSCILFADTERSDR